MFPGTTIASWFCNADIVCLVWSMNSTSECHLDEVQALLSVHAYISWEWVPAAPKFICFRNWSGHVTSWVFPFFLPPLPHPTGRGLSGTKPRLTRSHKTATQLRHMICQPAFRAAQAIAATKWVSRPSSHTFSYISSHSFQFVSNTSSSTSSIRSRLLSPSFLGLPTCCLPRGPEFNLVCRCFVYLQDIHPGDGVSSSVHSISNEPIPCQFACAFFTLVVCSYLHCSSFHYQFVYTTKICGSETYH
jgi:hypothetical protein